MVKETRTSIGVTKRFSAKNLLKQDAGPCEQRPASMFQQLCPERIQPAIRVIRL